MGRATGASQLKEGWSGVGIEGCIWSLFVVDMEHSVEKMDKDRHRQTNARHTHTHINSQGENSILRTDLIIQVIYVFFVQIGRASCRERV